MAIKVDVEKIQERKVVPATIIMAVFFVMAFFFMSFMKIPVAPDKHIEMIITFEEIAKEKEQPKEIKKDEKEKTEEQEIKEFDVTEVDETENEPIEAEEFEEQVDSPDEMDVYDDTEVYDEEEIDEEPIEDVSLTEEVDTDLTNNVVNDAIVSRGGMLEEESRPQNLEDIFKKKKRRRKKNTTPIRRPDTKTTKKPGKRRHLGEVNEIIEPIISWMENNHHDFNNVLKIQMKYTDGNLTSLGKVGCDNVTYVIYLLCKKELHQLAILFADFETKEFALIKNANEFDNPDFFQTGKFIATGSEIRMFRGRREAVSVVADKYNKILWLWFDQVKK
ncbi:hypothetical protein JXJ21_16280 [candidate division KSB1 bacterium]|nr:hypothetical protein [candidate division KSB1 bacterium]